MSKPIGSKSTVRLSLKTLNEKLASYPDLPIAVGKSWLQATSETLGIDFGTETAAAAETTSNEERPKAQVD